MQFPTIGALKDSQGAIVGWCCMTAPTESVTISHVLGQAQPKIFPIRGEGASNRACTAFVVTEHGRPNLTVLGFEEASWHGTPVELSPSDLLEVGEPVLLIVPSATGLSGEVRAIPGLWEGQDVGEDGVRYGLASISTIDPPTGPLAGCPLVRISDHAVIGLVAQRVRSTDTTRSWFVTVVRSEDIANASATLRSEMERRTAGLVGRGAELERLLTALEAESSVPLIAVTGAPGMGKTSLVRRAIHRIQGQSRSPLVAWLSRPMSPDTLLTEVSNQLREPLAHAGAPKQVLATLNQIRRRELSWQKRLAMLRSDVFLRFPLVVVLDDFGEEIQEDLRNEKAFSAQEILQTWLSDPGLSKIVVVSRSMPRWTRVPAAEINLRKLNASEMGRLLGEILGARPMEEGERDALVAVADGNPGYLTSLVSFEKSSSVKPRPQREATVSMSDEALTAIWQSLSPTERTLLVGLSVFREPVSLRATSFALSETVALESEDGIRRAISSLIVALFESGSIDVVDENPQAARESSLVEDALGAVLDATYGAVAPKGEPPSRVGQLLERLAHLSLLQQNPGPARVGRGTVRVHPRIASRLSELTSLGELNRAHVRAADYWQWKYRCRPQSRGEDVHDLLEARFHAIAVGDEDTASALIHRR